MSQALRFLRVHRLTLSTLLALLTALFIPIQVSAQHARYKLIDTGTLGGPTSFLAAEGERHLNNRGTLVSQADTSLPDPYCPTQPCFPLAQDDPSSGFLAHAAEWQNGVLSDLGALPGVNDSTPTWISDSGLIVGYGTNGLIDPLTALAVLRGIIYKGGSVFEVGTFGGYESIANAVNNRGQVVGCAATAVPDSYAMCSGQGSQQSRAFLWQNGVMQDLGTLGGPDAVAVAVNERGQVAGFSLTDSAPNDATGIPTQHPFLWENGTMRDLGTIGGTAIDSVNAINSRGQVVGAMNVAGDQSFHPFLWDGQTLTDLGTFGGLWGRANSINDAGAVVGWACTGLVCDETHAFLWRRGTMTDLTMTDPAGRGCDDEARSVNSRMQVVGVSAADCAGNNASAFLWENGSSVDLNTLVISNPSGAQLTIALSINERGEIAAQGVLPNGDVHAFLLVPSGAE